MRVRRRRWCASGWRQGQGGLSPEARRGERSGCCLRPVALWRRQRPMPGGRRRRGGGGDSTNGTGVVIATAEEAGGATMKTPRTRRPLLLPLAPLYGAALAMKRRLFEWGWLKQNRLESPVISVGSVSAGGAGKTPMV